jgi:hypothetical protein
MPLFLLGNIYFIASPPSAQQTLISGADKWSFLCLTDRHVNLSENSQNVHRPRSLEMKQFFTGSTDAADLTPYTFVAQQNPVPNNPIA